MMVVGVVGVVVLPRGVVVVVVVVTRCMPNPLTVEVMADGSRAGSTYREERREGGREGGR